jgi:hypothetical protein
MVVLAVGFQFSVFSFRFSAISLVLLKTENRKLKTLSPLEPTLSRLWLASSGGLRIRRGVWL